MAKPTLDGVIEAVHYDEAGNVSWVRAFLRRGPIWSDYVQLGRKDLIEKIQSGMQLMTGKRLPYYGGTFETVDPVRVIKDNNHEHLVSGEVKGDTDCLQGVPII
ncbi:MAG: hypothetical protein JSV42_11995 [Chloroflexota bacterium]|nr:MAG: hypothetical protein JSV42_11995 [Chloroflexota bacterium]